MAVVMIKQNDCSDWNKMIRQLVDWLLLFIELNIKQKYEPFLSLILLMVIIYLITIVTYIRFYFIHLTKTLPVIVNYFACIKLILIQRIIVIIFCIHLLTCVHFIQFLQETGGTGNLILMKASIVHNLFYKRLVDKDKV